MDDEQLMSQAVDLMIAGMGFVFSFLIFLVFATLIMSKLVLRFGPAEPVAPAKTSRAKKPSASASVDPDTTEAIKKAIAQYRARHKK